MWILGIVFFVLIVLFGLIGLVNRNRVGLTIPQSVGMATAVPGQILVQIPTTAVTVTGATTTTTVLTTAASPQVQIQPITPTAAPPANSGARSANTTVNGASVGNGPNEPQLGPGAHSSRGASAGQVTGSEAPLPSDSNVDPGGGSSGGGPVGCNRRIIHVVRSGENLFRIGLRYNTTASAIARLNGLPDVRTVRAGQRLVVITCQRGSLSGNDN